MKKLVSSLIFATAISCAAVPATADVNISVGIGVPLPPAIVFSGPPAVIVMPDTIGVYFVPDIDGEIYFHNGFWWRLWNGYWYRSRYYSRGWVYYSSVPTFYHDIDPRWHDYYRARKWRGHRWDYQRVPHQQLQQNWKSWNQNRHWEKQRTWGVQQYRPMQPKQRLQRRQQREEQYRQQPRPHAQPTPQVRPQRQQIQQPQHQPQRQHQERQQRPQHGRPDGGRHDQHR
ncbi:MAG TPA: hypothetical protein PLN25_00485 [Deltaproteobacteria bacterium]|nr:hypothetical protein [Deltaproteobacteria bacterium]HQB38271.1 hypothetical protein [Deltaproteobacteria bacterium]